MSLKNIWHHRKVADGSAKACWICYKPSTSVLITPDNKVTASDYTSDHRLLMKPRISFTSASVIYQIVASASLMLTKRQPRQLVRKRKSLTQKSRR
jgi:hypothetical protein